MSRIPYVDVEARIALATFYALYSPVIAGAYALALSHREPTAQLAVALIVIPLLVSSFILKPLAFRMGIHAVDYCRGRKFNL